MSRKYVNLLEEKTLKLSTEGLLCAKTACRVLLQCGQCGCGGEQVYQWTPQMRQSSVGTCRLSAAGSEAAWSPNRTLTSPAGPWVSSGPYKQTHTHN